MVKFVVRDEGGISEMCGICHSSRVFVNGRKCIVWVNPTVGSNPHPPGNWNNRIPCSNQTVLQIKRTSWRSKKGLKLVWAGPK